LDVLVYLLVPDRLIRRLGPSLVGDGDLLAMRGRVLELADDARPVIGDGDAAAAVNTDQQLVAAIRNTPVRSPDSMSWAGDA
jgi:hypothetical protein